MNKYEARQELEKARRELLSLSDVKDVRMLATAIGRINMVLRNCQVLREDPN